MPTREGKIFISYAHVNYEPTYRLYKELKNYCLDVWLDKEDLLPGARWDYEIRQIIWNSAYFVAIISGNSVNKKGYVQKELKQGLEILREFPENQIYFIPARIEECEPIMSELHDLHWVDLFKDWENGVERILRVFKHEKDQELNKQKEPGTKKKILLIEDEESIQLLCKLELEEEGYEVYSAYTGEEGLQRVEVISPDMVILDIKMPGMSGLEVLHHMRNNGISIPVILHTAYSEFQQDLGSWSSDEYVVKSGNLNSLKEAIKRHL